MKKPIGTIILTLVILCFIVYIPWLFIHNAKSGVAQPEVKYGEFPISIEYEINGQKSEIIDTIICKYDGIGINEGQGNYRKWSYSLASGKKQLVLLTLDNTKEICYQIRADYYMGDPQNKYSPGNDNIFELNQNSGQYSSSALIDEKEILSQYKIKIININTSQPIINKFN